jgi:hypothetical protein
MPPLAGMEPASGIRHTTPARDLSVTSGAIEEDVRRGAPLSGGLGLDLIPRQPGTPVMAAVRQVSQKPPQVFGRAGHGLDAQWISTPTAGCRVVRIRARGPSGVARPSGNPSEALFRRDAEMEGIRSSFMVELSGR